MGIILSQTEKDQFVVALKQARGEDGAGFSDVDIARTLCVSNGDFKNMLTGHKPPSQKHVDRLNNLLHSSPPRRVTPPPPPSKPAMALPDLTSGKPERPTTRLLYVGDDGGAPRMATPQQVAAAEPAAEPKESTDMTTTQVVNGSNGIKHGAKSAPARRGRPKGVPETRKRVLKTSLSTTELIALKKDLKVAIEEAGGNMSKVARGMGVDRNTLAGILRGKGGSKETREKFDQYRGKRTVTAEVSVSSPEIRARRPQAKESMSLPAEGFDLYQMAGRMLSAGRVSHAHLLSLIAKLLESSEVDGVIAVLRKLLPRAAAG